MDAVTEHTLANGLKVVACESHAVSLVSFFVWYRVGARNEPEGLSGASHWVEHMLFKRTGKLKPGDIGRMVTGVGGTWNGFTTEDTTAYFETVPANHLDVPLDIESDRMVNAVFDPDDVASERTVIISEREGNEASPMFLLSEAIEEEAFRFHPYGHGVIGSKADLNSMTRDDLYGYYRRYYGPNNAVVVTVGDFDTEAMVDRLDTVFGAIASVDVPTALDVCEPPQDAERRVELKHPGPFPILSLSHRVPEAAHEDFFALFVLDALLSGPKSGPFGGGATIRTSRLYQRFVASGMAAYAASELGMNIDPTLHRILIALKPGAEPEPIEATVLEEVRLLIDEPPSANELSRIVRQARARLSISLESVTSQAMWLGFLEMTGSWRSSGTFVERVAAVRPSDVQRVAATYFCPENRVTGWFIPASRDGTV